MSLKEDAAESKQKENRRIQAKAQDLSFSILLNETDAANILYEKLEQQNLVLFMRPYGGFEFVGSLNQDYPSSDERITTQPGEVVLYNSDQLVLFVGSNTWEYTPLGKIEDLDILTELKEFKDFELILSASR